MTSGSIEARLESLEKIVSEILERLPKKTGRPLSKTPIAVNHLRRLLSKGPLPVKAIKKQWGREVDGVTLDLNMLYKARNILRVIKARDKWMLPGVADGQRSQQMKDWLKKKFNHEICLSTDAAFFKRMFTKYGYTEVEMRDVAKELRITTEMEDDDGKISEVWTRPRRWPDDDRIVLLSDIPRAPKSPSECTLDEYLEQHLREPEPFRNVIARVMRLYPGETTPRKLKKLLVTKYNGCIDFYKGKPDMFIPFGS